MLTGSVYVGTAETLGTLHSVDGMYPTMVHHTDGAPVIGEIYKGIGGEQEAALIRRLNAIEGVPNLFEQKEIQVRVGLKMYTALCYVAGPQLMEHIEAYPIIHGGDWTNVT